MWSAPASAWAVPPTGRWSLAPIRRRATWSWNSPSSSDNEDGNATETHLAPFRRLRPPRPRASPALRRAERLLLGGAVPRQLGGDPEGAADGRHHRRQGRHVVLLVAVGTAPQRGLRP